MLVFDRYLCSEIGSVSHPGQSWQNLFVEKQRSHNNCGQLSFTLLGRFSYGEFIKVNVLFKKQIKYVLIF